MQFQLQLVHILKLGGTRRSERTTLTLGRRDPDELWSLEVRLYPSPVAVL